MENILSLKDKLTIVIPSKNESRTLYDCIYNLSKQSYIAGTRIIIADISDKEESINYINKVQTDFRYSLNIEVIKGGYPAQGRLYGSQLAETPYILFLDADVFLTNKDIISECIKHNKELITVPFYTDYPYKWVFRLFDLIQFKSTILGTPFAVGGFQLWNTKAYWRLGGYNAKNFKVVKVKGTYTSSRRFKSKGVLWMFYIMIKSYLNRNNPEFFKQHHGYWN